ncbi:hypothetical protein [Paenibacillus sp. TSA_86.1]
MRAIKGYFVIKVVWCYVFDSPDGCTNRQGVIWSWQKATNSQVLAQP